MSADSTNSSVAFRTMLVVPPGAGRPLAAFGSVAEFKLEGDQTGGTFCLALAETPPGVSPPPHVHHNDDELFLILEGEMSVLSSEGWIPLTPGTAVYLPRGVPHTFRNTGSTPSRHWVLTFPSGFDQFYREAAEMFAQGSANPERLGKLARAYGYEIFPPGTPFPPAHRE
jgi:mannose-6-phosphate isomerase-like protein (cupin superfamily)